MLNLTWASTFLLVRCRFLFSLTDDEVQPCSFSFSDADHIHRASVKTKKERASEREEGEGRLVTYMFII